MQCKLVSVFTLATVWPFYFGLGGGRGSMFSSESEAQLARYGLVHVVFNSFSTHFSYSPEASFGGEAVGNSVGEEPLSHEHHGFVEVAFLAVESRRNSFASTEPVG